MPPADCGGPIANPDVLGYLPQSLSWANPTPNWTRDRRPMIVFQMGSSSFADNPRANPGDWNAWQDGPLDLERDVLSLPNAFAWNTGLLSDEVFLGGPPGGNGVPDAFDLLIRRIQILQLNGFRRFVLHLPAGSQGVKATEWSEPHPNFPNDRYATAYEATTQSMNQFWGMPEWKRRHFTGGNTPPSDPNVLDWSRFKQSFTTNPNCWNTPDQTLAADCDRISLEVYVGGRIYPDICTLWTETTANDPRVPDNVGPIRVPFFSHYNIEGRPVFDNTRQGPWSLPREVPNVPPMAIDPRLPSHMALVWYQIKPWYEAGFRTVWLDAVSPNNDGGTPEVPTLRSRWGALELSHNPHLRSINLRIGGETFPALDPGAGLPDDCALATMPWFANSSVLMRRDPDQQYRRFVYYRNPQTNQYEDRMWLNRTNTEVHIVDPNTGLEWPEYADARQRGFITSMYFGKGIREAEDIKRWYSMGPIVIADFNGDSSVTGADYALAQQVIFAGISNTNLSLPIVFATGDVNQDGVVTYADWQFFDQRYQEAILTGIQVAEPFGGPDAL
ncbi:MAG: dockerin type I repeat-containing protein [Planctomycetota bacterium]|nr:dockerin type I repeat-containing protein [Planctomycetota bacterium]